MTPREWFRRLCFGLDTVLSLARLGFFIPYPHAHSVTPPQRYPAIAALFEEALPEMALAIDAVEAVADDLKKIARDAEAPEPRWNQDWFCGLDAAMLYAQIRQHRPARVVWHERRACIGNEGAGNEGGLDRGRDCVDYAVHRERSGGRGSGEAPGSPSD